MKPIKYLKTRSEGGVSALAPAASTKRFKSPGRPRVASLLVPVDFSSASNKAVAYAASLAEEFDAKITLLYVVEPVALPDFVQSFPLMLEREELTTVCENKIKSLARKAGLDEARVEKVLVRHGKPYHEIVSAARTLKADMIVVATHGYSGLTHALLGSVAERVVQHAPCPVLVVREKEREFIGDATE